MSTFPQPPAFGPPSPSAPPPAAPKGKKGKKGSKRTGEDGAPTKRVISRTRFLFIVFAVLAAALALLVLNQPDPKTYVVQTKASVGQFGLLAVDQVEPIAVDEASVEPGAISGPTAQNAYDKARKLIRDGGRLQYPIYEGQQLRPEYFTKESNLPELLNPDERLLSVSATAATSVSGNLRAGDRVDVIAVSSAGGQTSSTLLKSDVPIESVSLSEDQLTNASQQQIDPENGDREKSVSDFVPAEIIPGTYVMRLNVTDVPAFAAADGDDSTTLYLVYRGADAVDGQQTGPTFISGVLGLEGQQAITPQN